uniref:Kazal-like domain-containing protein n=1 Tax=Chelydra serpentina TaxID=8475 RepID=A0A8C3TK61_CHESE
APRGKALAGLDPSKDILFPLALSCLLIETRACLARGCEKRMEGQCQCVPQLCPRATACPAGLVCVCDHCGCCLECGNTEGQPCDLDGSGTFYGLCGENLESQLDIQELGYGGIPEPQCMFRSQGAVCGSDHITYQNICEFQEAMREREGRILITSDGPCQAGNGPPPCLPSAAWGETGRRWICAHGEYLVDGCAASVVAVEPHMRVAVSIAFAAFEGGVSCGLEPLLPFPLNPLFLGKLPQLVFTSFQFSGQSVSPSASVLGELFPAVDVDLNSLQVPLTDTLEAKVGPSCSSVSGGKFSIQQVFGDPSIFYAT